MSGIPKIKYPVTYQDLAKFGKDAIYFSGTWEDYVDLLKIAEYNLEFHENTIYTMSIASDPHEAIVKNVLVALSIALDDDPEIHIRPSNRYIFIKKHQKQYAPDAHVVKGKPIFHTVTKGLDANVNPWIIVEVLSPSTSSKDWSKKLPFYKKIPSLKYILYIEQDRPLVSVFTRKGKSSKWENVDYDNLDNTIKIGSTNIALKKIYNKISFIDKADS